MRTLAFLAIVLAAAGSALAGSDFNHDGFEDLAIGVPGESINNITGAGAVQIFYGSASGISITHIPDQIFSQGVSGVPDKGETNDHFGQVLATGDFDHDGFADLAIGTPKESVLVNGLNKSEAGCVIILYGTSKGLSSARSQLWVEGAGGLTGAAESQDHFGSALAVGDFDHDGFDDLAVGVPDQKVGPFTSAGAVHIIYGFPTGLNANRNMVITQDSTGILDQAEHGDAFGAALAAADFGNDGFCDLAIGVPNEGVTVNGVDVQSAGIVQVIYGTANGLTTIDQVWEQGLNGLPGTPQQLDRFGNTLAAASISPNFGTIRSFLAIGIANDTDSPSRSGSVEVLAGNNATHRLSSTNNKFINQDVISGFTTPDVTKTFGASLVLADFGKNSPDLNFTLDLAIGAPFGAYMDPQLGNQVLGAGIVFVIYDIAADIDPAQVQLLAQGDSGILDTAEKDDHFSFSMAAGNFRQPFTADLIVGVPDEDTNLLSVGAINVINGDSHLGLVSAGNQFLNQNSASAEDTCETSDQFGLSLGAGSSARN